MTNVLRFPATGSTLAAAPGQPLASRRLDLIQRYDTRVPRYTSYPTAPHFRPVDDDRVYRGWLATLPAAARVSLYVHVPFCAEMCWYCGCHTRVANRSETVDRYVDGMADEVSLLADVFDGERTVAHLHWGGGTPTVATPEAFARLMRHIRSRFVFDDNAEIAVEIDPRRLEDSTADTLAEVGVTRASLGVQTFDPDVQRAIHRWQPIETVELAVMALRRVGIAGLNFDLMYGLPGQTVGNVVDTIGACLHLRPQRVALFGYAHVPWMKPHQKLIDETRLPGAEARLDQFLAASKVLTDAGFRPIGLDHFARADDAMTAAARNGRLRRNFQGYTTDAGETLLGIGASSIGSLAQGYAQNRLHPKEYRAAVAAGRLPIAKLLPIDDEDRLRRAVIERLMCDLAVDLDAVAAARGFDGGVFDADLERLDPMQADGLVRRLGNRIEVTEAGRPFVRAVCAAFDWYLKQGEARHSRAV
jgi:oxygen-independent coproporphyrinogen-3 oxidase